jgi:hypothetical protein
VKAGSRIAKVSQAVIPKCGHAPQIEKAGLVNPLVTRYLMNKLKSIPPVLDPNRYLERVRLQSLSHPGVMTTR